MISFRSLSVYSEIYSLQKRGILERLDAGEVVIGDGGFLYCMERRGFVKAGAWTPEATVEHPQAGEIKHIPGLSERASW